MDANKKAAMAPIRQRYEERQRKSDNGLIVRSFRLKPATLEALDTLAITNLDGARGVIEDAIACLQERSRTAQGA